MLPHGGHTAPHLLWVAASDSDTLSYPCPLALVRSRGYTWSRNTPLEAQTSRSNHLDLPESLLSRFLQKTDFRKVNQNDGSHPDASADPRRGWTCTWGSCGPETTTLSPWCAGPRAAACALRPKRSRAAGPTDTRLSPTRLLTHRLSPSASNLVFFSFSPYFLTDHASATVTKMLTLKPVLSQAGNAQYQKAARGGAAGPLSDFRRLSPCRSLTEAFNAFFPFCPSS